MQAFITIHPYHKPPRRFTVTIISRTKCLPVWWLMLVAYLLILSVCVFIQC